MSPLQLECSLVLTAYHVRTCALQYLVTSYQGGVHVVYVVFITNYWEYSAIFLVELIRFTVWNR
jgi:hypothetical protein